LTILFWPAFADATCCCRHAGQQSTAEHQSTAEQSVAPGCPLCSDCCAVGFGSKLGGQTSSSPPCDCAAGCRSRFASLLPPVSQSNTFTIVLLEDTLDTCALLCCCEPKLVRSDASLTTSLSAQDHCARICSWLK
jgi:hypothetical protein